jgi:plastocyanin
MNFSSQLVLLCLISGALAQYGGGAQSSSTTSSTESATSTSSSTPGVQTVTVGKDNALAFSPDSVTAAVGSSVEFQFYAPIHSVTQSSFDAPCAPFTNGTGFWSGGITTTGNGPNDNVFTLTINDTNPIWFFCATIGHCETGMAGVINAP